MTNSRRRRACACLFEGLLHAAQYGLAAPTEPGMTLPCNVVAKQANVSNAVLATQVTEGRHPPPRTIAEKVAPGALCLLSPDDQPQRKATSQPDGQRRHVPRAWHHISLRALIAWAIVTPSAYSRSPPTGRPRAMRVTRGPCPASCRCTYSAVASPSRLGFVARITSRTPPAATRSTSGSIARSSGPTPSSGESRPPST